MLLNTPARAFNPPDVRTEKIAMAAGQTAAYCEIGRGQAAVFDQEAADSRADEKAGLQDRVLTTIAFISMDRGTVGNAARRPIKNFDKRAKQTEGVDMPHLYGARHREEPRHRFGTN
jgi:hypothetical protein